MINEDIDQAIFLKYLFNILRNLFMWLSSSIILYLKGSAKGKDPRKSAGMFINMNVVFS